jgi:hypothetical protein
MLLEARDRLNTPTPADAASEMEAFEDSMFMRRRLFGKQRHPDGTYEEFATQTAWEAWQAARTTPAAAEEWIVCKSCKGEGVHLGGPIRDAAGGTIDVMDDEDCRYCKGKGRLRLVDLAQYIPSPPAADAPQGGEGERERFEAWTKTQMPRLDLYRHKHFDTYVMPSTQSAWEAWQARATKADAPALDRAAEPPADVMEVVKKLRKEATNEIRITYHIDLDEMQDAETIALIHGDTRWKAASLLLSLSTSMQEVQDRAYESAAADCDHFAEKANRKADSCNVVTTSMLHMARQEMAKGIAAHLRAKKGTPA